MNKKKKEEKHPVIESVVLTEEEILTAPTGCRGFVAEIGPEEAQTILEHMRNYREDPMPTIIKKYTTDMKAGKWTLNENDNIVIYRMPNSGGWYACEGNHRMHAVIKSGTRQQFMVVVTDHVPHDGNYGSGSARTLAQYFKHTTGIADRRASSLASELIKQQHVHRSVVSRAMAIVAYEQYKDGIDFVIKTAAPKQKLGLTVPLFLAMVRGYYNATNPDRLREFAEAIEENKYNGPKDDGARLLNIQRQLGKTGSSSAYYLKCERAVSMFINDKSGSKTGFVPASYPGHLLPIPAYSGPGAEKATKTVIPTLPVVAGQKVYKHKAPYRIRQLLIANAGIAYTTTSLMKLYQQTFGEPLKQQTASSAMVMLYNEPNFTEPNLKNKAANERAIRYYVK